MKRIRGNNLVLVLALSLAAVSGFSSSRAQAEDAPKGNPIAIVPLATNKGDVVTAKADDAGTVTDADMANYYEDLSNVSDKTDANTKSVEQLQAELLATQVQMGQLRTEMDTEMAGLQKEITVQKSEMALERVQFESQIAAIESANNPQEEAKLIAAELKKDGVSATSTTSTGLKVVPVTTKLPSKVIPIAIRPTTGSGVVATPIPVRKENGIVTVLNTQINGQKGDPIEVGTTGKGDGLGTTPIAVRPVTTSPISTTPVSTVPVRPISTTPISTTPIATTPVTPIATAPVTTTPVTPVATTTTPATAASQPNWFEKLLISALDGISHGLENWAQSMGGPAPVAVAPTTPVGVTPITPVAIRPITLPVGLHPIVVQHVTPTINSAAAIDARLGVKYPLPIQRQIIRNGVVSTVQTGWQTTPVRAIAIHPATTLPINASAATNSALGGD